MPCKSFEQWSLPRQTREPIQNLSGLSIGIDATTYLKTFTETDKAKEPLVGAIGGLPFTVAATIREQLERLKQVNITPVFVFNGLTLPSNEQPFSKIDDGVMLRSKAWEQYEQGNGAEALDAFRKAEGVQHTDLERLLMDILNEMDIEFMVAPYLAIAQMAFLASIKENRYIDVCWGPSEILWFGVERAIIDISFTPRLAAGPHEIALVTTINRKQILHDLGISQDFFVDACILSGSSYLEAFPPLELGPSIPTFQKAMDHLSRFQNGTKTIKNFPETQASGYLLKYQKLRAAIRWHPILKEDGEVEPLNAADVPNDVIDFIGPRLPEELYFYVSRGVVSVRPVDMLVSGNLIVKAPLDGGDDEYRKFLDKLNPIRAQTLSLLVQPLNRWWYGKTVNVHYWFDKMVPRSLVVRDVVPKPYDLTKEWNVKEAAFKDKLKALAQGATEEAQRSKLVSFTSALEILADKDFAKSTITKKDDSNLLKTADEVQLNTIWRFLQLRGYINQETHELTVWGKALQHALTSTSEIFGLEEATLLAFELIRLNVISADKIPPPPEKQVEDNPTPEETKLFLAISKIASLASFSGRNTGFAGPLARANLTFGSFANALGGALRDLFESLLLSMLLHHETERETRENWYELSRATPFKTPINVATGLAMNQYLLMLGPKASDEEKAEVKKELGDFFSTAKDLDWDVLRGFETYSAVVRGLESQKEEKLISNLDRLISVKTWLNDKQ